MRSPGFLFLVLPCGGGSFTVPTVDAFSPSATTRLSVPRHSRHRPVPIISSTTQLRSSIDGGSGAIVPYQKLLERLPSESVIEAVESFGGRPVLPSDLSAQAGISLSQARKDLTALVALTLGDIAVSSEGELAYTFPAGVSAALKSNSAKYRALSVWREKVYPPALYATKIGFGVVLVASLVAIFTSILVISSGGGDRDDDRRDDRRGGG